MLNRLQKVADNQFLSELFELIQDLDKHFDEYQEKISALGEVGSEITSTDKHEPSFISENDLLDYEKQHLGFLADLFDLIKCYYNYNDRLKEGGADAVAAEIENELKMHPDYRLLLIPSETWDKLQRLLIAYDDKYQTSDLKNEQHCRRLNTVGMLMALEMNIANLGQTPFIQKRAILINASETLKNHYLDEINKELAKTDPASIKASYDNNEIAVLKSKHSKNKVMDLTLDKYQAISNICNTLDVNAKLQSPKKQVENFQIAYNANINTLKKNRDKWTDTFMKVVASTLLCVTGVGAFFVHKVWKTQGHKYEKEVKATMPRP